MQKDENVIHIFAFAFYGIGVVAGNFWGMQRISYPNVPEQRLCDKLFP